MDFTTEIAACDDAEMIFCPDNSEAPSQIDMVEVGERIVLPAVEILLSWVFRGVEAIADRVMRYRCYKLAVEKGLVKSSTFCDAMATLSDDKSV